jgi:hypothetical protein
MAAMFLEIKKENTGRRTFQCEFESICNVNL